MEIPGGVLLFLFFGCFLHCLPVQGQVAPKCSYTREHSYPSIWISTPPLLIEDTSLTVYFCSNSRFFDRAYRRRGVMKAAIIEANTSSTWNYTDYLLSCYHYECRAVYQQNVTNYLVTHHTFSSLQPNTLYSLEFLGCYIRHFRFYSCTVEYWYFNYRVNITTRPAAPQFQWLTTTEAIQIYFQEDYFTGPAPDGHEVLVWPKNGASHSNATALSHYFPLSTLNATVAGLLSNTEYFLYVRANGTHSANNQGAWVGREVRTRPLAYTVSTVTPSESVVTDIYTVPGVPIVTATVSRDTTVIVKLTPAQTFDLIEQCLVSVQPASGSDATGDTETVVDMTGNILFIEGLLPGTEYSYRVAAMNSAGRSYFTEWVTFTTTATVSSVVTGSSITLQWATPQTLDEESIASYVITLSPVQDTADAVTYTLPGSRQNATLGDLHPGATYQVQLKTETTSGLQPFYSANVTTATLQPSTVGAIGGTSELVWSGGGAGVMLAIVLIVFVCCVPVVVCCIVWRRRKNSRKSRPNERPKEVAMSNPNHYTQQQPEGHRMSGNEIEMDSNPAYASCRMEYAVPGYTGVEYTEDQVRYHVQSEVAELRRQRRGTERRRGGGEGVGYGGEERERGAGGGREGASGGQACSEIKGGRSQGPMYANIKVMV